jgi:hypothetical protein
MADYLVKCVCGAETAVSEWAIGAPLRCKACKRPLQPTEKNTRPAEEPKQGFQAPKQSDLPMSPEGRLHARREQANKTPAPKAPKPAAPIIPGIPTPPTASVVPQAPTEPEQPAPPVRETNCARCGRVFRGDWDRYRRSTGTVCHVCANLAPEKEPEEESAVPTPPPVIRGYEYKGVLDHPVLPRPDDVSPDQMEKDHNQFRQWIMLAGIVVIALAILSLTGDNKGPETGNLPLWATTALDWTVYGIRSLVLGIALYFLLRWRDRLPSDFLLANVAILAGWSAGLQILCVAMDAVPFGYFLWIAVCIYIFWDQFGIHPADSLLIALILLVTYPLAPALSHIALSIAGHSP